LFTLIIYNYYIYMYVYITIYTRGGFRGGGAPPLKLEKNMIFWRKIVIFHTKHPIIFFSNCGGRHEHFWGVSCEKSRFYAKKSYFFPILGGAPPPERTTDHGQATGKLYHLRLRVECTLFCNLQSRARTHAVLVIGLYELLDPTT
jgi:hypothetical protein